MRAFLIRILAVLLVVALGWPATAAQDDRGTDLDPIQDRLDRLRALIEEVEESGEEPSPVALVLLNFAADSVRADLHAAREAPGETAATESQIREAQQLLNRLSALLLLPAVNALEPWLDLAEAHESPVRRFDLLTLAPAAQELRRRVKEISTQLDPELQGRPALLTDAEKLLQRFYTLDFTTSANQLLERTQYWETLSPAPTAEELAPVRNEAANLEARLDLVLKDGVALPEETVQSTRAAIARAGTLDLIPFTESLMPTLVEMESRETALSENELAVVKKAAVDLHDRIEFARPGMLEYYDPNAPPACARAREVLRRLVSLELQPSIEQGKRIISELESREELPTEEELAPLRESAQELRKMIVGFAERVAASPEAEPDLIQQARELLWRFALVDLATSVAEMEPLVTALEGRKAGPSPEELTELNRLAEQMQPKLREARGKDEAQLPEQERQENAPEVVVRARDLMRRAAALQPATLAAAEEGRDAPVTLPFLSWFRFYGSLRLRTFVDADGFSRVDDETSRIGIRAQKKIGTKFEVFGRFEIGINPLELTRDQLDLGKDPSGKSELFPIRLAYAGVETPWGSATLGKVWSAYWNVAVFSDQLPAYTGLTTGSFNNGDGSVSGTGRTEGTIQYRGETGRFNYTGQVQLRNLTHENRNLADTVGGSTIFKRKDRIELGGAFSIVRDGVDDPDSDQPKRGDRSFIVGARSKDDLRYFGATLAYTTNHYQDELGTFFDGIGFEFYSDYLLRKRLRLRFVANGLFPIGGYEGDYRLVYFVAGASYDILKRLRIFLLPRLTFSKNSDGSDRGDHTIAILLLFNF